MQEKALADDLLKDSELMRPKWVRCSKLLKEIAEMYYLDAKREDERVELER